MNFRLIDIREKYDLSKTKTAQKLKWNIRLYSYIEDEVINFKLEKLNAYCNTFNCSMDYVSKLTDKYNYTDIKNLPGLDKRIIAENLKIIEKELNKNCNEMAEELRIAPSTYSDYKRIQKTNIIQTLMVKYLAENYGYSMDWICGRSKIKYRKSPKN